MPSAINITTASGVWLDVYASETIEVNMGGISLLSLENRTVTYTNKFKMPRTPVNESVFGFASQPTRNNKPVVDVIITKGIFQKRAKLTVTDFENDYQCSISYDSDATLDSLKALNVYTLFTDNQLIYTYGAEPTQESIVLSCIDETNAVYYPVTNTHICKHSTTEPNNAALPLIRVLQLASDYTFNGTLILDAEFQKSVMFFRHIYLQVVNDSGTWKLKQRVNSSDGVIWFSDILKAICQIFAADMSITGSTITLNKLDVDRTPLPLEGFTHSKQIYSGLERTNYIRFEIVDKAVSENFAADIITADGKGEKELFKIKSKIPGYYSGVYGGYDPTQELSDDDIIIMSTTEQLSDVSYNGVDFYEVLLAPTATPASMEGVYSDTLNPILSEPVILKAQKYLTQLEFDTLTTDRVLVSVQLGGRYWVDSLAYNLTTGNAVMTLIKL